MFPDKGQADRAAPAIRRNGTSPTQHSQPGLRSGRSGSLLDETRESSDFSSCLVIGSIDFGDQGKELLPSHQDYGCAAKQVPERQEFTQDFDQIR